MTNDKQKLIDSWNLFLDYQNDFMKLLQEKRSFPQYPVDVTSKTGQKIIKDCSHEALHELFEAIHLLKNSKSHRKTEIKEFDEDSFVEELVDCYKYLTEIFLLSGVSAEKFADIFLMKTVENNRRINEGY